MCITISEHVDLIAIWSDDIRFFESFLGDLSKFTQNV